MLYISTDNSTQLSKNPSWIQNKMSERTLWCTSVTPCGSQSVFCWCPAERVLQGLWVSWLQHATKPLLFAMKKDLCCPSNASFSWFMQVIFFFFPFFLSPYQIAAVWALYLPDLQTVFCIFFPCSLFSLVTKSAKVLDNIKHLISIQGTVSALT